MYLHVISTLDLECLSATSVNAGPFLIDFVLIVHLVTTVVIVSKRENTA